MATINNNGLNFTGRLKKAVSQFTTATDKQ